MTVRVILIRDQEEHVVTGAAIGAVQIAAHDGIRFENIDFDKADMKLDGRDLLLVAHTEAGDEEIRLKDFISAETGAPAANIVGDDKAAAEIMQAIEPAAGQNAEQILQHSQRIGYTGIYEYVYNNLALAGPPHDFDTDGNGDDDIVGANSQLTDVPGFYDDGVRSSAIPPLALINLNGDTLNFQIAGLTGLVDRPTAGGLVPDAAIVGGRPGALISEMVVEIVGGVQAGDDLHFRAGTDTTGFTVSAYDPVTHLLRISGIGTFAQYDAFIHALELTAENTGGTPPPPDFVEVKRSIQITVTDDGATPETATATVYGADPAFTNGDDVRNFNDPAFDGSQYADGSQFIGGLGGDRFDLPQDLASAIQSGYTDSLGHPLHPIYGDLNDGVTYDPAAVNTADSVVGSIFNDTIYGESGQDSIEGGQGDDYLIGGDQRDTLVGGTGADTLDGSTGGDDDITFGDFANYVYDNANITINLNDNSQNHGGDAEGDVLLNIEEIDVGNGNNFLTGNAHRATNLQAGTGANTLVGGDQGDLLVSAGAGSSLVGGDGADTLQGQGTLLGGDGADSIQGSGFIDGGAGDDIITAGSSGDTIFGGVSGFDRIDARGGDDLIIVNGNFTGDATAAFINGGGGSDTLQLLADVNLDLRSDPATPFQAFQGIETIDLIGAPANGRLPATSGDHSVTLDVDNLSALLNGATNTLRILADIGDVVNLSTSAGGTWSSAAGASNTTIWTNSADLNQHIQIDNAAAVSIVP